MSHHRRDFLLASGAMGVAAASNAASYRHVAQRTWLPSRELLASIPGLMRLACVPGLSMAAVEGGALAWHGNFGIADAEAQTPVTDDSLFEAASTSKPVFAYVALQLVERGELDLDRPL